jgi:hypothetical protein
MKRKWTPYRTERVFNRLCELAGDNGQIQISRKALGAMLDTDDTGISYCIRKLEQMGYIETIRTTNDLGTDMPNTYVINQNAEYKFEYKRTYSRSDLNRGNNINKG